MDHQYSSAPAYGANYTAAPHYSPFAPSAGQLVNPGTAGIQQANVFPHNSHNSPSLSNGARYDANAQLHSQSTPLPFTPQFNPDLFKHFPPPPIPPIPPPEFMQRSVQHYSFPQLPASLSTDVASNHHFTPTQGHRPFNHAPPAPDTGRSINQVQTQLPPVQVAAETPPNGLSGLQTFDIASRDFGGSSADGQIVRRRGSIPTNSSTEDHILPRSHPDSAVSMSNNNAFEVNQQQMETHNVSSRSLSQPELKERAKAALLSLVPYSIRYQNLIGEGIDPQVLQQLYDELGLNWKPQEEKSNVKSTQAAERDTESASYQKQSMRSLQVPVTAASSGSIATRASTTVTPMSQLSPTISPNIERKDRIAQLLAAKAAKTNMTSATSKSQSPASTTNSTQAQPLAPDADLPTAGIPPSKVTRNLAQAEIVRQKMEQLKKEAIARSKTQQAQHVLSTLVRPEQFIEKGNLQDQQHITLSTPMREHLLTNGLSSIPGLFMTSADHEHHTSSTSSPPDSVSEIQQGLSATTDAQTDEPQRSATIFSTQLQVPRKRSFEEGGLAEPDVASESRAMQPEASNDMDMDLDQDNAEDASEGEIVEEASATEELQPLQAKQLPVSSLRTDHSVHEYLNKQTEIETMRKRIAQMEQRQSIKRGQSYHLSPINSATSTPTGGAPPQNTTSSPPPKTAEEAAANPVVEDRTAHGTRSFVKATPEQIAERAAQLKADFLRTRALRHKQLQEGIPALDDQVVKTQTELTETRAKLSQIRTDMQQYQLSMQRAHETEKQLLQKLEHLEKQVSAGLSSQKQFSNELNSLKQQNNHDTIADSSLQQVISESVPKPQAESVDHKLDGLSQTQDDHLSMTSQEHEATAITSRVQLPPGTTAENTEPEARQTSILNTYQDTILGSEARPAEPEQTFTQSKNISYQIGNDPEVAQIPIPIEDSAHRIDRQDDYSDEAMDESDDETDDSHMSIDEETNDSASMSDSGSDDYEPAEPDEPDEPEETHELISTGTLQPERTVEDDGDDYEPAEDYETTEDTSLRQGSDISTAPHSDHSPPPTLPPDRPLSAMNNLSEPLVGAIDITATTAEPKIAHQGNEPPLSEADTLTKVQSTPFDEGTDGLQVLGATDASPVRYVPYQSPLSSFKSYRFNPHFNEKIKDGYRSLTYSHKIDPKKPICPSELSGNTCTDPECQDQHFGSMAMTDDKILVQMSSASDIKDKNLRDQYLLGLKQVIAKLRQEGVKEFSAVANALSQYRREWTAAQARS